MRRTAITVLVIVAAVLVPVAAANAGTKIGTTGGGDGGRGYVPGQLIVKFRAGQGTTARSAALHAHGARVESSVTKGGAVLVDLPDGANVRQAATAMRRDPSVAWAQPNYYQQGGGMPNDALFAQQWALHNTGQVVHGIAGTAGADIHAPEAWDRTTGSTAVKVAVVDSGITFGQPDLAPNIWHNPGETGNGRESNGVDDDGDGFVDDWQGWDFVQQDNNPTDNYGHGTEIASILGARGGNGIGVSGVAQQVSILPVRVLDNFNITSCAEGAKGLAYAVKAGARVVNFSVGSSDPCQPQRDVIDGAPNVLFVVSSMNEGANVDQSPQYPCSYPEANIVCVGATDAKDQLWQESNYGAQSVDLAAPGVNVLGAAPIAGTRETIYEDGFENPLFGHWLPDNLNGGWDRTQKLAHTGSWSLTDSPNGNYANNTNSSVYLMEQLNLVGKSDCYAKVWVKRNFSPFPASWPGGDDAILAESSPDYRTWGRRLAGRLGSSDWEEWDIDLSELEGRSSLGAFRFRLQTDEVGAFDGVYLDDFTVRCLPMVSAYSGAAGDSTWWTAPRTRPRRSREWRRYCSRSTRTCPRSISSSGCSAAPTRCRRSRARP